MSSCWKKTIVLNFVEKKIVHRNELGKFELTLKFSIVVLEATNFDNYLVIPVTQLRFFWIANVDYKFIFYSNMKDKDSKPEVDDQQDIEDASLEVDEENGEATCTFKRPIKGSSSGEDDQTCSVDSGCFIMAPLGPCTHDGDSFDKPSEIQVSDEAVCTDGSGKNII